MVYRLSAVLLMAVSSVAAQVTSELIHFTVDNTENGTSLFPEFTHHSCWSGIGRSSGGDIYIAVSNHEQPADENDEKGNVALYKYDSGTESLSLLGDIKSSSEHVDNWMANESQHKVHTFIMEHADGRLYFASDDYAPSFFLRGAHMYYIDPANDTIVDFSKTQPNVMLRDMSVIANTGQAAEQSGIFVEYYGIKGISLNPQAPDLIYAMTYPDGHIIKYTLSTGAMEKVGQSADVSYVFYTDNSGNIYYCDGTAVKKYTVGTGATTTVGAVNGRAFSMMAPTASGDSCYFLASDKEIYLLDCVTGGFSYITKYCGTNWSSPGLFNMTLSPDGSQLYFINPATDPYTEWKMVGSVDVSTGLCTKYLDSLGNVLENRSLAFGGVNVWDNDGNFYVPVWNGNYNPARMAVLKVHIPEASIADKGVRTDAAVAGVLAYPNPMSERLTVRFTHINTDPVTVCIADRQGRTVATLHEGMPAATITRLFWEGRRDNGADAGPGIYLVTVNGKVYQKFYYNGE